MSYIIIVLQFILYRQVNIISLMSGLIVVLVVWGLSVESVRLLEILV